MNWHDWIEVAKVAGALIGSTAGAYFAARSNRAHLLRQDRQLEWQSRVLERAAEDSGSVPPPREKLATLDDPWEVIERQVKKR